jgi:hypothetical protein
MIKLKQLLTEYSEHSFKMPKLQKKIYMGYFKKLMPKTARTEKKAEKRLKDMVGKWEDVHVQYHEVQPKNSNTEVFIHQSHYHNAGVVELNITLDPDGVDEYLGGIFADKNTFLKELQSNFKILKKG